MVLASPEYPMYYDYGESVSGNAYPQPPASDYLAGTGANADPVYDFNKDLGDDAEEVKNNLAIETGPGKRGTRGLILKKLIKKGIALLLG